MQLITYAFLAFALVLFFVVRQFLRRWGLGGSANAGDYGLGKVFYYGAFFVGWFLPVLLVWLFVDVVRIW